MEPIRSDSVGDSIDRTRETDPRHPNQPTTTSSVAVCFADLNDFCLTLIFKRLQPIDLMNVSIALGGRIANWAKYVFGQKFGGTIFKIGAADYVDSSYEVFDLDDCTCDTFESTNKPQKFIDAYDEASIFLKEFGHLVTDIKLYIDDADFDAIDHAMTKHCSKSLKKLAIDGEIHDWGDKPILLRSLERPFENVEIIEFDYVRLHPNAQLHEWFPKMRCLHYNNVDADSKCLEQRFPNLTRVRIMVMNDNQPSANSVMKMILLNPQLTHLTIDSTNWDDPGMYARTKLFYCTTKLPNLMELNLTPFSTRTDGNIMSRKSLSVTFNQIKSLELSQIEPWCTEYTSFIMRQTSLEKLYIDCNFSTQTSIELTRLVSCLPNLKRLKITNFRPILDLFRTILSQNETLESILISRHIDGIEYFAEDFIDMGHADKWDITDNIGNYMKSDEGLIHFKRKIN